MCITKDIEEILKPYREKSKYERRRRFLVVTIIIVIAIIVFMYAEGEVRVVANVPLGSAWWKAFWLFFLIMIVFFKFGTLVTLCEDYCLSDETLERLSETEICNMEGFKDIQRLLLNQGYVKLSQVEKVLSNEKEVFKKREFLKQPGGNSILQKNKSN